MKAKTCLRLFFFAAGCAALYYIAQGKYQSDLREKLGKELGEETDKEEAPVLTGEASLANPLRKLSFDQLRERGGLQLALEDLADNDPKAYCILTEHPVYGVRLRDSDGLSYDFRYADKPCENDISGMYYDWAKTVEYPKDDPQCTVQLTGQGQGVCRWEDDSRVYTISMTEGASVVKLAWMRDRLLNIIW